MEERVANRRGSRRERSVLYCSPSIPHESERDLLLSVNPSKEVNSKRKAAVEELPLPSLFATMLLLLQFTSFDRSPESSSNKSSSQTKQEGRGMPPLPPFFRGLLPRHAAGRGRALTPFRLQA